MESKKKINTADFVKEIKVSDYYNSPAAYYDTLF